MTRRGRGLTNGRSHRAVLIARAGDGHDLRAACEAFILEFDLAATTFSTRAAGYPTLMDRMRRGCFVTPEVRARVEAYMARIRRLKRPAPAMLIGPA